MPDSLPIKLFDICSSTQNDMERGLPNDAANHMLSFGRGRPHPPLLPDREDYVVDFDGPDDPAFPQNWPMRTR